MNVSVVIATCGAESWGELARDRALGSVEIGAGDQVILDHFPDGTVAGARNEAAARARCDWLCFLDADDRLGDGYVAAMKRAQHHWNLWRPADVYANPLLLAPAVQYVDGEGRCVGSPEVPSWGRPLIDVNCAVIGTLIPRYLFVQAGGFGEWASLEDWELFLRLVLAGARIAAVPDAVYCASAGDRRNADQSPYHEIRRLHADAYAAREQRDPVFA